MSQEPELNYAGLNLAIAVVIVAMFGLFSSFLMSGVALAISIVALIVAPIGKYFHPWNKNQYHAAMIFAGLGIIASTIILIKFS